MTSKKTKRIGKHRLLVILAVSVAAMAGGAGLGFLLGRMLAAQQAETRLQQYASRIMADGEASTGELRTVLAAVGASPHSYCSDAEIGYFRALIFESEYLKDAGRMRDGKILCSAALGRAALNREQFTPVFTQQDGTIVYKNLPPYQKNSDLTTITLQLGGAFVVFTPLTRMHLEAAPMHYIETLTDSPTQTSGPLLGELPPVAVGSLLTTEGESRLGESLFATRCSIHYFNCITAYTSIPEIVAANRARFVGGMVLCGLLGVFFSLALFLLLRRNKSLEQQLRRAIRQDKLRMVYQPIVNLESGRVAGAEALVRWTDEDGFTVGPDVFVRIAEERGFVGEITRLVVRHVLRDFGPLLRSHPGFRLSINVAAEDLGDAQFLPMLDAALKRAAIPAKSLAIEITEGSTVRYEAAMETIRHLRERGHSVHIDDFGTGYSSLAYLHNLSVDAIKIDRAFTQAIGTESVIVNILPQILAMAEALKLGVIVEGAETAQQADYFRSASQPIFVQGWFFGRPVPVDDFRRLLVEDEKKAPASAPAALASDESHTMKHNSAA
jgi:sensor c-di-GMP phosphodiesterase-like protein